MQAVYKLWILKRQAKYVGYGKNLEEGRGLLKREAG